MTVEDARAAYERARETYRAANARRPLGAPMSDRQKDLLQKLSAAHDVYKATVRENLS